MEPLSKPLSRKPSSLNDQGYASRAAPTVKIRLQCHQGHQSPHPNVRDNGVDNHHGKKNFVRCAHRLLDGNHIGAAPVHEPARAPNPGPISRPTQSLKTKTRGAPKTIPALPTKHQQRQSPQPRDGLDIHRPAAKKTGRQR